MHNPKGLLDTRLSSPRAPVSIVIANLEEIWNQVSLALSQNDERRKNPKQRTSKNRVPTGKMRMYHPPLNSTKSKVM